MNADDHELIERMRKINKTLSMFVFALQEGAAISVEGQLNITNLLDGLADTIRMRVAGPVANADGAAIDGARSQTRLLESGRPEPEADDEHALGLKLTELGERLQRRASLRESQTDAPVFDGDSDQALALEPDRKPDMDNGP